MSARDRRHERPDLGRDARQRDGASAIRSYSGGARSDLYTVRRFGSLPEPLDEELSALAVSAAGEAVLTSTGVTVYDTQFHALWHYR